MNERIKEELKTRTTRTTEKPKHPEHPERPQQPDNMIKPGYPNPVDPEGPTPEH